jgi:hypothetical protein
MYQLYKHTNFLGATFLYISFTRISKRVRINWESPSNRVLLEEPTVRDPLKISSHFFFETSNPRVHYRVHKSPSLVLNAKENTLFPCPPSYSFGIHLSIIFPLTLKSFPAIYLKQNFSVKYSMNFPHFSTRARLAAHLILFHLINLIKFGGQSVKLESVRIIYPNHFNKLVCVMERQFVLFWYINCIFKYY